MSRTARVVFSITLVASMSLVACSASVPTSASPVATPGAQSTSTLQALRVRNIGTTDIVGLVVIFPDERVAFGDVPAGGATDHYKFGKGVFRYAAYEHRVGAATISQPVVDWVGEQPMPGQAFTYSIEAVEGLPRGMSIRLVAATRDQ